MLIHDLYKQVEFLKQELNLLKKEKRFWDSKLKNDVFSMEDYRRYIKEIRIIEDKISSTHDEIENIYDEIKITSYK